MSKNDAKASGAERGDRKGDSVFDFLYQDARRIGSFLAQFDKSGHLKEITETESASKEGRRGWKAQASGSVGSMASGGLGFELGPRMGGSEMQARVYDPLWTNARTFLDFLDEFDLIRAAPNANFGEFVLLTGKLEILNLRTLQGAWEDPIFKALMSAGAEQGEQTDDMNRAQRRALAAKAGRSMGRQPTQMDIALALLKLLPHPMQAYVRGDVEAWFSLTDEGLSTTADDLLLKHGVEISGTWSVLGLLDAEPDTVDTEPMTDAAALVSALTHGIAASMMRGVAPLARIFLGRPGTAYGITPLLIFRKVAG